MMKTLVLLRHAKAENGSAGSPDFDRALNERGRREANAVGRFVRKQELALELAVSSPAKRARETAELVLASAGLAAEVKYDERVYEAGPLRLMEVILEIEEERSAVLLVGHNPGLEDLLALLTGRTEPMATGTCAKIDLEVDRWQNILEEKGRLNWIVRPKELADDASA